MSSFDVYEYWYLAHLAAEPVAGMMVVLRVGKPYNFADSSPLRI